MKDIPIGENQQDEEKIVLTNPQKIQNKKIYFEAEWTQVKIGYDEATGVGFVQLIKE